MKLLASLAFLFVLHQDSEWKTIDDSDFQIKHPGSWVVNQSGAAGTKFILFSPDSQSPAFKDNINLIIQDLNGQNIDLNKFSEISVGQIKQFITNANILQSNTTHSRHEIIYTGSQGQFDLKWQQYYWVKKDKAYILTFTALQDSFDKQIATATRIMESFIIK